MNGRTICQNLNTAEFLFPALGNSARFNTKVDDQISRGALLLHPQNCFAAATVNQAAVRFYLAAENIAERGEEPLK